MYSSTVSSAVTFATDKPSGTISTEKIDSLCRNRPFYEPVEEFDGNYIYKLYENPLLGKGTHQKKSKRRPLDRGPICKQEIENEEEAIKYWIEKKFKFDKRSFVEKIEEDGKNKIRNYKEFWSKLKNREMPWYVPNWPPTSQLPCKDRYFSFPALIVNLGHTVTHYKTIRKYIDQGYQTFLIDVRAGTCEHHLKTVEHINYVRKLFVKRVFFQTVFGIALQISGRNLRTGYNHHKRPIFIERDSKVILTADRRYSYRSTHRVIYINFYDYLDSFQVCDKIKIGSSIVLVIYKKCNLSLECRVLHEGLLEDRMQVEVPIGRTVNSWNSVTHEEEMDIDLAFKLGCDFIICSCVYYAKLVQHIYWTMAGANREMRIIARIDLSRLVVKQQIDYIIKTCYGVMLDSTNILNENRKIRDFLIRECFLKNKIIIRINSINNDKITDMASDDETLKQMFLYPDAIVVDPQKLSNSDIRPLIVKSYSQMNKENLKLSMSSWLHQGFCNVENVFTHYLITSVLAVRATCIIVVNNNGRAVQAISQHRPLVPIIASYTDVQTARATTMLRNVYQLIYYNPMPLSWHDELDIRMNCCIEYAKTIGCILKNEPFIFAFETQRALGFTDTYRILQLDNR